MTPTKAYKCPDCGFTRSTPFLGCPQCGWNKGDDEKKMEQIRNSLKQGGIVPCEFINGQPYVPAEYLTEALAQITAAREEGEKIGQAKMDNSGRMLYQEGRIAGIREMGEAVKREKITLPEGIVTSPPVIVIGDIFGKDIDHLVTELVGEEKHE